MNTELSGQSISDLLRLLDGFSVSFEIAAWFGVATTRWQATRVPGSRRLRTHVGDEVDDRLRRRRPDRPPL